MQTHTVLIRVRVPVIRTLACQQDVTSAGRSDSGTVRVHANEVACRCSRHVAADCDSAIDDVDAGAGLDRHVPIGLDINLARAKRGEIGIDDDIFSCRQPNVPTS